MKNIQGGIETLKEISGNFLEEIKTEIPKDKIVEDLKREFDIRSCIGINKYKTTLQDNNSDDFLQHLKEELMDAALYIQKIQSQNLNK
jgi:hypothetical protein